MNLVINIYIQTTHLFILHRLLASNGVGYVPLGI